MPDYSTLPEYTSAIRLALENIAGRFINFLPEFLGAVVVLLVLWFVATWLAKVIKSVLNSVKVDEVGDKLGLDQISSRTGVKMSVAGAIAWLVKWFILIGAFLAAADILNLEQISEFLNRVLLYIPNVIGAAAILLVGAMLASFLARLVRHSVQAAGLSSADMVAAVIQWSVMVFTVLAALDQLGIARSFVNTLFTGIIAMLAIAGGLAFGLGGREHATKVLNKIERDIKS